MNESRNRRNPPAVQSKFPVIGYNEAKASSSFNRYRALRLAERDDPTLADDITFQAMLFSAREAFEAAFLVRQ